MAIPVKINVFEGPLDLLLHLNERIHGHGGHTSGYQM